MYNRICVYRKAIHIFISVSKWSIVLIAICTSASIKRDESTGKSQACDHNATGIYSQS